MIDPIELIEQVHRYGAKLRRIDGQHIKVIGSDNLPPELIEQLRVNKPIILKYLEQSSLDVTLKRALDGYYWLLERKQQHYRYNGLPPCDAHISVQEWRQCIADVIKMNPSEVQVIENLLIQNGALIYYGDNQYIMGSNEAAQTSIDYGNVSFSCWLDTGRQFFRH